MGYDVIYSKRANRDIKKLDPQTSRFIKGWIEKKLIGCMDPRALGKGLTSNRSGQWRYRIGDYRLICEINDTELVILALTVGHRSKVYDG